MSGFMGELWRIMEYEYGIKVGDGVKNGMFFFGSKCRYGIFGNGFWVMEVNMWIGGVKVFLEMRGLE